MWCEMKIFTIFLAILLLWKKTHANGGEKWFVKGAVEHFNETALVELQTFCHEDENMSVFSAFKTLHFHLVINSDEYEMFEGDNSSSVLNKYMQRQSNWFNLSPWKKKSISVPVFKTYCIGVSTKEPYQMFFRIRWLDYLILLQMIFGIAMFFMANKLSKNAVFYYGSGIGIGVLASLLILVFIISRSIPKKKGAYAVMIFGWTLCAYVFQLIFENIIELMKNYKAYFIGYVLVAAMISFGICYKYGPIDDMKTQNLTKWFLQAVSLLLIFFSSENKTFSAGVDVVVLSCYNFSFKWPWNFKQIWYRKFPPKIKLLTEEEYIQEGNVETRKALEELRSFCQSPDCNAWETMSHLKTPSRFIDFVNGSQHISDWETTTYDDEMYGLEKSTPKCID